MRKPHDPICRHCDPSRREFCSRQPRPCAPVAWIDGNAARREPLLRDMAGDHDHNPIAARDYKTVLADALRARTGRIEDIRQIENMQIRSVAALLYAEVPVVEVARIFGVSRRTVYRMGKMSHPLI